MFIRFLPISLIATNCLFGSRKVKLNSWMKNMVLCYRQETVLFDLIKVMFNLRSVLSFIAKVAIRRGRFLFVGYPVEHKNVLVLLNQYQLAKWIYGILSNNYLIVPLSGIIFLNMDGCNLRALAETYRANVPAISIFIDSDVPPFLLILFIYQVILSSLNSRSFFYSIFMKSIYLGRARERFIFLFLL